MSDESNKSSEKVIDLAARRAAMKRKRISCLTPLLDERSPAPPEMPRVIEVAGISATFLTPEEIETRASWTVGAVHRAPTKPKDKP